MDEKTNVMRILEQKKIKHETPHLTFSVYLKKNSLLPLTHKGKLI